MTLTLQKPPTPVAIAALLLLLHVSTASLTSLTSGTFPFEYEYDATNLELPEKVKNNIQNGHGLIADKESRIYFTYQPINVTTETKVLVRFEKNALGKYVGTAIGEPSLSAGVPHGLRIEHDKEAGKSFLYHANNDATIFKTDTNGKIVWKANFSNWQQDKPQYWPLKPTDSIVIPNSDILLLADGYGSSYVHALNKTTGEYIEGKTFGGKGNTSSDPIRFNTPHGINIDEDQQFIVVSDRSNNRIVFLNYEGEYKSARATNQPEGLSLPCNENAHFDSTSGRSVSVIPSLGNSYSRMYDGAVGIYDSDGQGGLLSVIEVAKLLGREGHQHPHDAILLENGDAVVCCWSGPSTPGLGPAKGTISYWKRLKT